MKKIKRFLLMNDWLWSILIAFAAYLFVNYGPPMLFNMPMAYFSINWLQPLIATGGIMAGLYTIARLGLWFNIRNLHDYMYGKKSDMQAGPKYYNPSYSDFKSLKPWQKLFILCLFVFFFFISALIVFLRFIPLAGPQ